MCSFQRTLGRGRDFKKKKKGNKRPIQNILESKQLLKMQRKSLLHSQEIKYCLFKENFCFVFGLLTWKCRLVLALISILVDYNTGH